MVDIRDYMYTGKTNLKIASLPTDAGEYKLQKAELTEKTRENMEKVCELQEKLYAAGEEALVIALQARDAAGKDSLIKKIFSGLNPAALEVHAFKVPSALEASHDYLWRLNAALPPRGKIALFNRSHYEDVLAVKVHNLHKNYRLAPRCVGEDFFDKRYRQLRRWEEYLYETGTRMVKVFLNVSRDEQKKRFLDRMELDEKHWKLSTGDIAERAMWKEYDEAYEAAINETATPECPWFILPADTKWFTRYLMSEILLQTLTDMAPEYPPLDPKEAAKLPQVMEELAAE